MNKRTIGALAGTVAALVAVVPAAHAAPPTVVKLADEGAVSWNPPELSCSDFGYTWGIRSTILETAGVSITRERHDGGLDFRTGGNTVVAIEAADGPDAPLGGPVIVLRQAGMSHFDITPGETEFVIEFAGPTLLGAAFIKGTSSVTFDENFNLVGFTDSPNATRLCEALAP